MVKEVYILEEWNYGSEAWVIKGVVTSKAVAQEWYDEDKDDRDYHSMELDEIH